MLGLLPLAMMTMAVMPNPDLAKLEIVDAKVAPADAGSSAAVSMILKNTSKSPLIITGASTPLAGQTVLQRYGRNVQGLMQVQPIDSLALGPESETVMVPGALEIQLVGLTTALVPGLELPLTLKFFDGNTRVVRVRVQD